MASAGFLAVTGRNDAPTCVLAHIVTPSSVSYYLSSAPYVSGDSAEGEDAPTNIAYTPIISGFPRVRIGIDDFLSGQASVSWGELVLATDENVAAMFGTPGASITLFVAVAPQYRGLSSATAKFPSSAWRECILIGKVSHFRTNQNRTVSIIIQSVTREMFDKSVASTLFDTTNTPTLPAENLGRRRPFITGSCRNVAPVLINAAQLEFQNATPTVVAWVTQVYDGGLPIIESATVAAYNADATKLNMAASASAGTNHYFNCACRIISGTGSGQARTIATYDGPTKVATLSSAWTTRPDTSSVYEVDLWRRTVSGSADTFRLISPYFYNVTCDVTGDVANGLTPIQEIWQSVLGKTFANCIDQSGATKATEGLFIDDATSVGEAISMLARARGCVWATVPKIVSGVPTEVLIVVPITMPASAAVASFDESSIISYDLMLDTDVVWRVTGHDKRIWSTTEKNAANSLLPVETREWLSAGFVPNLYANNGASTNYGAREIDLETLRYDSVSSTTTLTQLVDFFSGATRKRLRITVPAFFPSPILMEKISVTLPANISTYSGDYALTGWTTYTDNNVTVLMDLELFG